MKNIQDSDNYIIEEIENEKILFIDGNSLLYKYYFGIKNKISEVENGENLMLRIFSEVIIKFKTKTFKDYHIVVAFDHPNRKTYRQNYEFYKKKRKKDDLYEEIFLPQFYKVMQFLKYYGIKFFISKKLEGDDIIGILAKQFSNAKEISIITSDHDLLQLIRKNVNVMLSKPKIKDLELVDLEKFVNEHNLHPKQYTHAKALIGDNSDNIGGILIKTPDNKIRKITKEEAYCKIREFGNIYNMFVGIENSTDSVDIQILKQKEKIIRNIKIITIIRNWNLWTNSIDDIKSNEPNYKALYNFLDENDLSSIIKILKRRKKQVQ